MDPLIKDLIDLIFQMTGFVNTFWVIYSTVVIAMLGWIFSSKQAWPVQQRVTIAAAYLLIVTINSVAQYRFNVLLHAATFELNSAIEHKGVFSKVLREAIRSTPLLNPYAILLVHLFVDLVVVYLIQVQNRFVDFKYSAGAPIKANKGRARNTK